MLNLLTEHEALYEVVGLMLSLALGLVIWLLRGRLAGMGGTWILYLSYICLVLSMLFTVLEDLRRLSAIMQIMNMFEHLTLTISVLFLLFWIVWMLRREDSVL